LVTLAQLLDQKFNKSLRALEMTYFLTTISVIHFLTALAALFIILLLWKSRKSTEVEFLIYLEFFVAIWAISYALEFGYSDLNTKILWSKLSYFGIAFLGVFYFLFTTAFSQKRNIINARNVSLLLVIPVITIVLVLTNEKHLLIWPEVTMDYENNIAHYSHGIAFWIFWIYSETLLILGLYNLLKSIYDFPTCYKNQIGTLLVATMIPIIGNLMYLTNINPYPGFDWTPVSFVLTGIIIALGIARFRMFDIVPLARTKLFEIINDGVIVINTKGTIEDCNSAVYSIFDYQGKSIIHEPFLKIFNQFEKLTSALSNNLDSIQLEVNHKNQRKFYHVRITPVYRNKNVSGKILLFHDITSIKEVEDKLKMTNKKLMDEIEIREKLIEDLDAFAHTVAHDLKNSLSSIFSASEIMDELIKQNDKNLLRELSGLINLNATKSIQITHDLLMLATTDKTCIDRVPLNMKHIFDESKKQLSEMINNSNALIMEPDEWPRSFGYAPWIEEVWTNYISNALKYGGTPPVIKVGADDLNNGNVMYWIQDNGKGLTKQDQKQLFKNFVRLEPEKAEGYGLGLSIVKKIIEKLDGSVGVESNNEGSKFFFILPAAINTKHLLEKLNPKPEFTVN
jgi:PAS domain S-box-containing protein